MHLGKVFSHIFHLSLKIIFTVNENVADCDPENQGLDIYLFIFITAILIRLSLFSTVFSRVVVKHSTYIHLLLYS